MNENRLSVRKADKPQAKMWNALFARGGAKPPRISTCLIGAVFLTGLVLLLIRLIMGLFAGA